MLKKETILKSFNEDDAKEAIKIYEKYKGHANLWWPTNRTSTSWS